MDRNNFASPTWLKIIVRKKNLCRWRARIDSFSSALKSFSHENFRSCSWCKIVKFRTQKFHTITKFIHRHIHSSALSTTRLKQNGCNQVSNHPKEWTRQRMNFCKYSWKIDYWISVTTSTYNCRSDIIFAPIESWRSRLSIGAKIISLR